MIQLSPDYFRVARIVRLRQTTDRLITHDQQVQLNERMRWRSLRYLIVLYSFHRRIVVRYELVQYQLVIAQVCECSLHDQRQEGRPLGIVHTKSKHFRSRWYTSQNYRSVSGPNHIRFIPIATARFVILGQSSDTGPQSSLQYGQNSDLYRICITARSGYVSLRIRFHTIVVTFKITRGKKVSVKLNLT